MAVPEDAAGLEELEDVLEDLDAGTMAAEADCQGREAPDSLRFSCQALTTPAAIVDRRLDFVYRNQALVELLQRFGYPMDQGLFNTFGRCLGQAEAASLYRQTLSAGHGYSWRGQISHKTRRLKTMRTSLILLPYLDSGQPASPPCLWNLYLHDLTEEADLQLKQMFTGMLQASKLKDNDTGKHIERVNLYSCSLAEALFREGKEAIVDRDFVETIGLVAAMHDVGKIGTPDDILNKQGPLNDFEWSIMRQHTINGAFILASYPNPMAKEIALAHHERWDGSGYPYQLQGKQIPLPARLVAIADVYDALRMQRSYKEAFSHQRACAILEQDSGSHFDPELIAHFMAIHKEFEAIYEANRD